MMWRSPLYSGVGRCLSLPPGAARPRPPTPDCARDTKTQNERNENSTLQVRVAFTLATDLYKLGLGPRHVAFTQQ